MKKRVTQKSVKAFYPITIKIGYCRIQTLLSRMDPIAYTASADGWGADIYAVDGVALVTGYRPFGKYAADYEMCQKYEARALEVLTADLNYSSQAAALTELTKEFIKDVMAQY